MKKLSYLLLVMFTVVLISTSCEEDESLTLKIDEANAGLMTLAELDGQWYVDTYLYDGTLWTVDSEIPDEYDTDEDVKLSDIFDSDWNFDVNTMTTDYGGYYTYDFTKNGNTIKISYQGLNLYTYTIISYSENQLKVIYEDIEEDAGVFDFKGGTITFIR